MIPLPNKKGVCLQRVYLCYCAELCFGLGYDYIKFLILQSTLEYFYRTPVVRLGIFRHNYILVKNRSAMRTCVAYKLFFKLG